MAIKGEISESSAVHRAKTGEDAPTIYSKIIFVLLCAMLIFSVIVYGSVDTGSLAVSSLFSAFIVVLWVLDAWKTGQFKYNSSLLQIPLLALGFIGLVQLLPLRGFDLPEQALSIPAVSSLSLNPYITRLAVIQLVVYSVFFAALLTFINGHRRLKKLILTILIFSSAMAFYGILQRLANLEEIYGVRAVGQAIAFASFINQHHFAAFMEMTLGLTLGILFGKGEKKNIRLFLIIAAVIMGMAIIFTGSRGGMISLLAVLGFIVFINVLPDKKRAEEDDYDEAENGSRLRRNLILVGGGFVLIFGLFAAVILLGGDQSVLRGVGLNSPQGDATGGRLHFWQIAWRIFLDYPIIGAGLDAYGTAFPLYDTWNGMYRIEQAHNDYLQILADAGILGFACVAAFIFLLFRESLKNIKNTSDDFRRNAAIGALAGCFGILIHSFFDFPLRTPSNALYFLAMTTIATVSVHHSKHRRRKR
jgi:O-antigen ligase